MSTRRQPILDATLALIAEAGVDGTSVDAVAARAGVGKATIYRHWGSRATLLADACELLVDHPPAVDTGDLRADLVAHYGHLARTLADKTTTCIMRSVIDAANRDDELGRLRDEMVARRREPVRQLLMAARARGDIPSACDLDVVMDTIGGPLFYRAMVVGRAPTEGLAETVVDLVLAGLGPPA